MAFVKYWSRTVTIDVRLMVRKREVTRKTAREMARETAREMARLEEMKNTLPFFSWQIGFSFSHCFLVGPLT